MVLLLTKVVTFRRQAAAAEVAMTDVLGCLERMDGRRPGPGRGEERALYATRKKYAFFIFLRDSLIEFA